jgi:phosphoglycolate phosphatase
MTAPPPSILLDLDGTIVDSQPGIAMSCHAALAALGHRPEALDVRTLIGPPLEEVLGTVLRRLGDDRVDEAVRAYRDHYGMVGLLETTVYPGVAAALDHLAARGARLYVATSKRRSFAERILEHLGLIDRFAAIHGSEPDGALDHKPQLLAHVIARHDLAPGACVMVGDRRHDIAGAHANGMRALGVLWGYGDREELEAAGADAIVAEPAGLAAAAMDLAGKESARSSAP